MSSAVRSESSENHRQRRRQGPRPVRDFTLSDRFYPERFSFTFRPLPDKSVKDAIVAPLLEKRAALETELNAAKAVRAEIRTQIKALKASIDTKSPDEVTLREKLTAADAKVEACRATLNAIFDEQAAARATVDTVRDQVGNLSEERLMALIAEKEHDYQSKTFSRAQERELTSEISRLYSMTSSVKKLDAAVEFSKSFKPRIDEAKQALKEARDEVSTLRKELDAVLEPRNALFAQRKSLMEKERAADAKVVALLGEFRKAKNAVGKGIAEYETLFSAWRDERNAAYAAARAEYEANEAERRAQWEAAVEERVAHRRSKDMARAKANPHADKIKELTFLATQLENAAAKVAAPAKPEAAPVAKAGKKKARKARKIVDFSVDTEAEWLDIDVATALREADIAVPLTVEAAVDVVADIRRSAEELELEGAERVAQAVAALEARFAEEDAKKAKADKKAKAKAETKADAKAEAEAEAEKPALAAAPEAEELASE